MNLGLTGKRAIVLAASRGLGRAVAECLAAEGCELAICARDPADVAEAAAQLGAFGMACDVSSPAGLASFLDAALETLGGVDILVTNCGGPTPGRTDEMTDEDWAQAFELVFMSVVRSCARVVPLMRAQSGGRIVHITSVSVREPIAGLALSNALRPAIAGYAKTLALEVARDGIHVHCVMPGSFLTDRNRQLGAALASDRGVSLDEVVADWERGVPLGRMGEPLEFGRVVAFLASDACSFATGTVFPVEGGGLRSI